ncbi:helix-turn-helix transcriptional regulator [Salmonella enterica subsp. enterica serovar Kottbus]|uniref:Helix-turn-helix transcriptional regulator n=2 Tax=Salmonella enterica TaxID=28901 RepID=A0A760DQT3_SALER|nr:helix-turn-helix transcriptional regulator [Salmonella enterica subsp. enterica serovar Newport]EAB6965491.1 helix-turn-helix transcriptional regulator [Salmonella enterica subsp. enterica serovar Kottbus]EAR7455129.1 helix-turn-helix transcriptional regulator [Salmonella enterica]ECD3448325.1 helix-turn-helix transcriptional regulator [Salmonella enterica subsp. enterica serovar Hadar]ECD9301638.1 helix-turn-helix transcriptional regulator [Salmonella enterica subsp. salamae]ECH3770769.1 h
MSASGLSQAQLAEMVGISQPAIQKMSSGKTSGTRKMVELANALKVRPEWLSSGVGEMRYQEGPEPSNIRESSLKATVWEDMNRDSEEFVEIPLLNVSLSAGNGSCELEESSDFALVFRRYYLKKMGVSESAAKLVRVSGQSMEPTLNDGDVVGVNTQDTAIRDGKTYAICQSDLLRVKTLIATPTSVIIRSINRDEYPDEVLDREDFQKNVRVIGRVFWSSHSW